MSGNAAYQQAAPFSPSRTLEFSCEPLAQSRSYQFQNVPYRAKTFGSVPNASRSMIGTFALLRFMMGYALVRNDLSRENQIIAFWTVIVRKVYLTAALGSEVWQK